MSYKIDKNDKTQFEAIELLGEPALFFNGRVDRSSVPPGFYCYDLRGGYGDDPGCPCALEENVLVNHAGTVLTNHEVDFSGEKSIAIDPEDDDNIVLNFGYGLMTVDEFIKSVT